MEHSMQYINYNECSKCHDYAMDYARSHDKKLQAWSRSGLDHI
jgi:hypothetical protein